MNPPLVFKAATIATRRGRITITGCIRLVSCHGIGGKRRPVRLLGELRIMAAGLTSDRVVTRHQGREQAMARKVKRAAKSKLAKRKARAKAAKPIDLYYWPTPNGFKISIMLEECGLPYKLIPVNISNGEQFKPDFLKISPNNRMPAIVDPDGPGGKPISIFESGAILQYLGRKTGKFYPRDERKRVEVDQWLFWQMGGIGPMAGQVHHFRNYAVETLTYAIN